MRFIALVGCVMLLAQLASAIYEDQAGKLDWSVQNLGRVFAVEFGGVDKRGVAAGARGTSRALYVATDSRSRAIARVDSKSGSIKWRRVLSKDDSVDSILLTNAGLVSVSGSGRNVRLWDVSDGSLVWDNLLPEGSQSRLLAVGDDRVVVVSSRHAAFISLKDGSISWSSLFDLDSVDSTILTSDSSVLFVLGRASSSSVLLSIDVTSGSVIDASAKLQGDAFALHSSETGEAVLSGLTSTALKLMSLESGSKSGEYKASKVTADANPVFARVEQDVKRGIVVRLISGKRIFLRISKSLEVDVIGVLSSEGVISEFNSEVEGIIHVVGSSPAQIQLNAVSPSSEAQWAADLELAVHGGEITNVFGGCLHKKKDSAVPRCRALLVMKDDGLVMTTNEESSDSPSKIMWTREEALANIKDVQWITPAETEIEKQPLKGIPSFFEDVEQDAERLKQLVQHLISLSSTFLEKKANADGEDASRHEQPNSHFFGFSKYIVILSESGRLFAIRAETNEVAWSTFVGPSYRLFVTRDHPALGAGAELLLVSNSSKLVWIDGDDGREVDSVEQAQTSNPWVVLLPKRKHTTDEDTTIRRSIALVDRSSLAIEIFPSNDPTTKYPEAENFYFTRYDDVEGSFGGYTIDRSPTGAYAARLVWSISIPTGHRLLATSYQREGSAVDSSVTITGDDSLLLKYLNPHLFGFATEGHENIAGESRLAPVLQVTLVDAVTGRIIHRVRHLYASGPVQIVQSENWVVYAYWNVKEKRTDMVSLSLFDGAVGSHSLNLWKRPAWNDLRSSYDPRAPFVLQKAFIFPGKIETLGVTITSRGITPQYVLVGMKTGQIFKLNRALIDPRQLEKPPTAEEQNEGLIMYTPLIPLHNNLHSMITYNQTIAGLKTIGTTPVELESTTLVFAHGLDLFYLRLAPAKAFDVLPPDFNYELLVILCLGFFGATYVLKTLTLRKSLNEAWK